MLAQNIKKARTDKLLSQRALADIIGVSQQTVGSWEVGREVKTVKPKAYVELHCLTDELPHSDVEELLNTTIFKKKKAEQAHEHVDDPDDF